MTKISLFCTIVAIGCFALSAANATVPFPEATVLLGLVGVVLAAIAAGTFRTQE
jgi:hypothetical protein